MTMFNKIAGFNQQQGFTLVEVLTVMLVLTAVAAVTVETASTLAFQGRYEVTKDRYEKIKKAIIGDPNQIVNGQPNIKGFVKDMGRLPENIRELTQPGYCVTSGGSAPADLTPEWLRSTCSGDWLWSNTPCTDGVSTIEANCIGGHRWLGQKNSSGLTYGWNGPYLSTTKDPTANTAFVDGWGNTNDNINYGWNFSVAGNQLIVQSIGKNQAPGGALGTLDEDYPAIQPAITSNDWMIDTNSISLSVLTPSNGACNSATCSDPIYPTQTACESPRYSWNTITSTCSNPIYTTSATCLSVPLGTWEAHNAIKNCNESGNQWVPRTQNICLKIIYRSIDVNGQTVTTLPLLSSTVLIPENGRGQEIHFTFPLSRIPIGDMFVGVYNLDQPAGTVCTITDAVTYPATCQNTLPHGNFTQTNCEANGGHWRYSATPSERTCINMLTGASGNLCTGTTSPQLGGTWVNKPLIPLSLTPNTTLPTINW